MKATLTTREVLGPDKEWLTEEEVRDYLGSGRVSETTLKRYIAEGLFPQGIQFGRECMWHADDVVWFLLGKRLGPRLTVAEQPPPADSDDTPFPASRQKGANRGSTGGQ